MRMGLFDTMVAAVCLATIAFGIGYFVSGAFGAGIAAFIGLCVGVFVSATA